jgi:hypothetical protein
MKLQVDAYAIAYRAQLRRERWHASWLRARHKQVTKRIAVIEAARKGKAA